MNNGSGRSIGEVDGVSDTTEIANMAVTDAWEGLDLFWERGSGVKDEAKFFFVEAVGKISCAEGEEREGLIILDVDRGRPIRRKSVWDGLSVR